MGTARVLLVDDDEDVRRLTRISLGFEGFAVSEAADGDTALALLRAERPDAVVLDVMMPGRDGLDVLRELRADTALADLPVVVLTAKDLAEHELPGGGPTALVGKPFTAATLAGALRRLLGDEPTGSSGAR